MYRKDKQFMKNPATAGSRIYVGAISKTVIPNDLEEKFKPHGNILGLVLNNGFGFIQYETEAEAQAAIKNENGCMFHGRKLVVKQALSDRTKPGGGGNQGNQKQDFNNQQKPAPPPNQSPRQNVPPQKTPPPPPATTQHSTPPQEALKPPDREHEFDDENMEEDRLNIRPPGPPPHDDRGRKNFRNQRGGDVRGRSKERGNPFMDRFEPPQKMDMYRDRTSLTSGEMGGIGIICRLRELDLIHLCWMHPLHQTRMIVKSLWYLKPSQFIEQKLKNLGLIVDLLFPNEDVPIGKVLANISSRGCLYAILVMPQNEENRSLTLNILHGVAQEHRNMPIEDALILLSRNFEGYMKGEQAPPEFPGQNITDRHPGNMQMLLNLLAENRQISTTQYDKLLKYLQDRREMQQEFEVAEGIQPESENSDPKQVELQSRIMNILNKSDDVPIPQSITASEPPPPPTSQAPILKDPTVQKALDSLLLGDMFKSRSSN
ncbi:hypothetical protein NQ317_016381 [Molorchus minor]|uniref:RRM domain-containing protein n=1 Tax=Molorchus minor TaxID=1323400 RepID=A0ABQ9JL66_9CUCU|nr:hypothetical protein NQ317_016381 [Molorchus minor]